MKLFLLGVSSFIFAFIGQSCCPSDYGTEIVGITNLTCEAGLITIEGSVHHWVPNSTLEIVKDSQRIGFRISYADSSIRHIANSTSLSVHSNMAMACDPEPTRRTLQSKVSDLTVSTLYDLNDTILKGMDVTDLFSFAYQDAFRNGGFELVKNDASEFVDELNEHYRNSYYWGNITNFLLKLNNKQFEQMDTIQIEVLFKFVDGMTIGATSNRLVVE